MQKLLSATLIQGDQTVSLHLMVTVQSSGAQRLFDQPVYSYLSITSLCEEVTHRHTSVCHEHKQTISMKLVTNVTSLMYKHLQINNRKTNELNANVWINLKLVFGKTGSSYYTSVYK
jgi:hypothetical protein